MTDRGDIVLGWLTRLSLALGVLGVLVFDGVALGAAHFEAADAASTAARAAAEEYRGSHDVQKSYDAAYAAVRDSGDTVGTTDFVVAPDGSVTLSVTRTAHTLVMKEVGPLRRYTVTTAKGSGRATS
ncbi:MAG: hypothetical protein JWN17_2708 [Frankiales bacterium]|nr:hypothetical protein [Frankiales bacterium]